MTDSTAQPAYGVQLYSVRELLRADPFHTLRAIAAIGYREVELLEYHLEELLPMVHQVGLTPVSVHVDTSWFTGRARSPFEVVDSAWKEILQRKFDSLRARGLGYVVLTPLRPHERSAGRAFWQRFSDWTNAMGELAARSGLRLAYHHQMFEFGQLRGHAFSIFDLLVESCDPAVVGFEIDVFWVAMSGLDPALLLRQLCGRVHLVHLKDIDPATMPETDESNVPPSAFVEVGAGVLDTPAILQAARSTGVPHLFIEQDHSVGHPLASLRHSFRYLCEPIS